MVTNGEMDEQFDKVSKDIRARFKAGRHCRNTRQS
jgi:hypothetical protein